MIFACLALYFFLVLCGYKIQSLPLSSKSRTCAWSLTIVGVTLEHFLSIGLSPLLRMLFIIAALFAGVKTVVTLEEKRIGEDGLSLSRWLMFSFGWLGARGMIFAQPLTPSKDNAWELAKWGTLWLVCGSALLSCTPNLPSGHLTIMIIFLALSLIIHFGLLNLLAAFWQTVGVNCESQFRAPFQSTSLSEFWGRRWNVAFSEMASIGIYRPLSPWMGTNIAALIVFIFSGLVHELVISLPVLAGFGLPMLYFLIHGLLVVFERYIKKMGYPINRYWVIGWAWTMLWILLPFQLVFHQPFLDKIALPFIGMK